MNANANCAVAHIVSLVCLLFGFNNRQTDLQLYKIGLYSKYYLISADIHIHGSDTGLMARHGDT